MSQVNPSNIAAGVAQGALQQSQAARSGDAQRSQSGREAQKAREKSKKEVETVEDLFEAGEEHLRVDGEPDGGRGEERSGKDEGESEDPPRHIDVRA